MSQFDPSLFLKLVVSLILTMAIDTVSLLEDPFPEALLEHDEDNPMKHNVMIEIIAILILIFIVMVIFLMP